jgi:hypothetical protein
MVRTVLGVCALSLLTRSVLADPAEPRVEDAALQKVVAASVESVRKLDWKAYAEQLHPDSLRDFKGLFEPLLRAAAGKKASEQVALVTLFDGGPDLKTALGWPPKEFFVRFMKGTTARGPLREVYANSSTTVLGTVREGNMAAHVVVRTRQKMGKVTLDRVDVVTLKPSGRSWKIVLPEELRGLGETIKRSLPPVGASTKDTVEADRPDE